ncbi:hypothetical protein LBMAG53_32110 [Planctomycetota bacterium]|nr:hypothetical protein LBMAG53_32110 [Planctomycetota bacterium]
MSRVPARPTYDAEVLLMPLRGETTHAHALFKRTYTFDRNGRCVLAPPEPLLHDWRDPAVERPLLGGSDFWLTKPRTDLVVQGAVCAPEAQQVVRMRAGIVIGSVRKEIAVSGPRAITWRSGRPVIGDPAPFTTVPMAWSEAYGGIDWRVAVPGAATMTDNEKIEAAIRTRFDHPGMYPRNPFGRGYLVETGEVEKLFAPCLEDPADLLTADRLVIRDPATWWRQPLPWCLDWTNLIMFPRAGWFAPSVEPWYPVTDDATLPEVQRGLLPADYRSHRAEGVDLRFFQGASHGLAIDRPATGATLRITGMHPERTSLDVVLPPTQAEITFVIEGRSTRTAARLHHVVVRPSDGVLTLVFASETALARPFIPGIHKHIPVAASLDGDDPVPFPTPPTARERMAAAQSPKTPA